MRSIHEHADLTDRFVARLSALRPDLAVIGGRPPRNAPIWQEPSLYGFNIADDNKKTTPEEATDGLADFAAKNYVGHRRVYAILEVWRVEYPKGHTVLCAGLQPDEDDLRKYIIDGY